MNDVFTFLSCGNSLRGVMLMCHAPECRRVRHFGELAPECATTYYKYGCALFDKLQDEADPLGETVNPANAVPSSNGEGSSGKGTPDPPYGLLCNCDVVSAC